MRSVPRNIHRKGEHLSICDVCGVMYLRSSLRRGSDNLLRCPNDMPGRNAVTLAEVTARDAARVAARLGAITPADGARPDTDSDGNNSSGSQYTGPVSRRTLADVYFEEGIPTYADPGTLNNYPGF